MKTRRITPARPASLKALPGAAPRRLALAAALALTGAGWIAAQDARAQTAADQRPAASSETGTKYDADSGMQQVLDTLAGMNGKPIETLSAEQARKQPTPADAAMAVAKKEGKPVEPGEAVPGVTSIDRTIPGPAGALPVRVYTPKGNGPFPVIVYYHGGGWVIADKEVYDAGARGLSAEAKAVVVSVDYRRAPEAKFPAAWDDALAAYKWVAQNASQIKGDPKRLALAGESAGGNLAVSTAIAAIDAGVTPPVHVLAVYPVAQTGNLSTDSYVDSAQAKPLNKPMIAWFVEKTFAKPADKSSPRVDLVNAKLTGLPPVTIINAEIDPLRTDGELLEDALEKAGVEVERKVYEGTTHEFFGMAAVVDDAEDAQEYAGERLRESFGR
ncbi:MAG: alpha/beta hydrolase [Methylibium sp.]|uniref:alpha/beta hydrolase n=1 Tax=Methylibium sp. TaxID=2067992 RepID=UPI0017AFE898|nr:alpha/beta hydrolase [Methylibium sp.]MBA3597539.1 alpha/beta hydrolase [Methylibium sp.]